MAPTTTTTTAADATTHLLQALPALIARQYTNVRVRRSRRLHPAAIFGIAAGCLLLLVFSVYLVIFCCFRKWYKERRQSGRGIFGIGMNRHGAAGAGNLRHGHPHHPAGVGAAHYNRTQEVPQMGYSNNNAGGPYGGGQFPSPGMPSGYYSGNHQQQTGGITNGVGGGMGGKMDGGGYGGGGQGTTTGNY